jgi:MraZ protein
VARFRGEASCKVDAKGRFFLPPIFRRAVEASDPNFAPGQRPELVIVYGDETRDFLEGYTIEAMDALDARIARLPEGELKEDLLELYSQHVSPTDVDPEGRILLSPKAREKLNGETDIELVARGETFRIWASSIYSAHMSQRRAERGGRAAKGDLLEQLDAALAEMDRKG